MNAFITGKELSAMQGALFEEEEGESTAQEDDDDQSCNDAYWDRVLRHIEWYHTGVFLIETEMPLSGDYDVHYCYARTREEARTKFLTVYPYFIDGILDVAPTQLDPYTIARSPKFVGEDQYFAAKQKREQERAEIRRAMQKKGRPGEK